MSQEHETLHKVLAILPTLQSVVNTLHEKECARLNKEVTHTSAIVDVADTSISHCRIDAGTSPVIRLSGVWTLECIFSGRTELIVEAIRRGIIIAHKRLRWTLGKNKPRIAAEYVASARGYRIASGKDFSLPVESFRTRLTVTVSDPMTGEVETRENVRLEDVTRVQRELAHTLTAKVYAHEQIAMVLDELEGQKLAAQDPAPVVAVALSVISTDYAIQRLTYENYVEGISHVATVDIDELPEVNT
jgi:hypothetical protein